MGKLILSDLVQRRNPHLAVSPTWCVMCKEEGESLDHFCFIVKWLESCGKIFHSKQVSAGHLQSTAGR